MVALPSIKSLHILCWAFLVAEIFSTSCYNTNRDANRKPSPKAEIGAKKLADMFEKMMR